MTNDPSYVRIFDTTLRDGEQSPGATMTSKEKLEVAKTLSRLGVDVIEAGFPAASPDDLRAVRAIAETVGQEVVVGRISPEPPSICGLARAAKGDLDKCWEAIAPAKHPRIHTFLATSPIHREHKLRMSKAEVVAKVREMVTYARSLCADIEFSPEDAGRTEMDFLYEVLAVAIEAGATTLNIPDTVGYTLPHEYGDRIRLLRENVPGIENVVLSVHCHDDLGLAVANSLSGVLNGARQVEVAINGIGERAGNTSLEEIAMALHTRRALLGLSTGIDTTQLTRASRLVSKVTGMVVQPNKAIVGANAFAHEAGIHQDGMLKNEETYEIMRPETVGASRTQLVLGKHSGRHAFGARLAELGYPLDGDGLEKAFARFKALADKKKRITDADLVALVSDELYRAPEHLRLDGLQVACGSMGLPTATLRLKSGEGEAEVLHIRACVGTGPVDAVFKAIDQVAAEIGLHPDGIELLEYTVTSVTEGIDALGEVSVRVRSKGEDDDQLNPQREDTQQRVYHGHGTDTDIIVASAKAYLSALNRLVAAKAAQEKAA
ncbi:MAG: 2-isopropylmalate synthase [Sandaracinus sp.]|nr:2-isopropylmalate synthase [Sandaracinus sp.]